jgi:hypothetical protein
VLITSTASSASVVKYGAQMGAVKLQAGDHTDQMITLADDVSV